MSPNERMKGLGLIRRSDFPFFLLTWTRGISISHTQGFLVSIGSFVMSQIRSYLHDSRSGQCHPMRSSITLTSWKIHFLAGCVITLRQSHSPSRLGYRPLPGRTNQLAWGAAKRTKRPHPSLGISQISPKSSSTFSLSVLRDESTVGSGGPRRLRLWKKSGGVVLHQMAHLVLLFEHLLCTLYAHRWTTSSVRF